MAVQGRLDISNIAFIRQGTSLVKEAEVVAQDGARTTDLEFGTVMAQNPTSLKWVPLTDVTLNTGEQLPQGVLLYTIPFAQLVAGDVVDMPILKKGEILDRESVILENSLTFASVITNPDLPLNVTVESWLAQNNIFTEYTVDITGYENA